MLALRATPLISMRDERPVVSALAPRRPWIATLRYNMRSEVDGRRSRCLESRISTGTKSTEPGEKNEAETAQAIKTHTVVWQKNTCGEPSSAHDRATL